MYTSDEIEFDPEKDLANQKAHDGLRLTDAASVLDDPFGLTMADPDSSDEQNWLTVGQDSFGKLLMVCWTERNERIRLISSRLASPQQRKTYHDRRA